ncbi:RHS repeat-associated core domain-containing protein [Acidovorax sp. NPDC077693]|uniref:RHS repeat-associated core domain-containing protein n=1 Tax=unclassified Acidovorax TaxID=2684926 RepID=UPI0037CBC6D8
MYYFHTQPNGLPEELSDNSGNLVWRAQYTTWGSTVREEWQSFDTAGRPQHQLASQTASLQQNLRMQGQYLDRETGLHYNTFRYYDADLGAFTTPDPIGLLGWKPRRNGKAPVAPAPTGPQHKPRCARCTTSIPTRWACPKS